MKVRDSFHQRRTRKVIQVTLETTKRFSRLISVMIVLRNLKGTTAGNEFGHSPVRTTID